MPSTVGWILDAYTENRRAVVWVKSEDGQAVKLTDQYSPDFYALPRQEEHMEELLHMLRDTSSVESVEVVRRRIAFTSHEPVRMLHITLSGARRFRQVAAAVENNQLIREVFNVDLAHTVRYITCRLGIEPTSKVHAAYSREGRLDSISKMDEEDEFRPPPFSSLTLSLETESNRLTPDPEADPLKAVRVTDGGRPLLLRGSESEMLEELQSLVASLDPDIIIAPDCDRFTMPYLYRCAEVNGFRLRLGRDELFRFDGGRRFLGAMGGRICLDTSYLGYSFHEWGLAGLVERCRFSLLPPRMAARWLTNRAVDSRCCFELTRMGYVIPRNRGGYVWVRQLRDVVDRDRGGLIMSPRIGKVHENVAALDFDSYFPNIICKHNISYETARPEGVDRSRKGILPLIVERFLHRRLHLKKLRPQLPKNSPEWRWCNQRVEALKLILVCCYGISGCCWNRFGNVLAFEEINRVAREGLLRAKDLALSSGYEIVYSDTDSFFVTKRGACREDFEALAREISEAVGLPMSLEHHFKFLVFLPLESDPLALMEAQKRYFGVTTEGELVARGIELRRHDTPGFIKAFQEELIHAFLQHDSAEEVCRAGYEDALRLVYAAGRLVLDGRVSASSLVVSKTLGKRPDEYLHRAAHVSVATILRNLGRELQAGDVVEYVFKNHDNPNPMLRAIQAGESDHIEYDRVKYLDLLLDAAKIVLGQFGFKPEDVKQTLTADVGDVDAEDNGR